jgi:hypothetical protein
LQQPERPPTAHVGQAQVEHDRVRLQVTCEPLRILAGGRLTDHDQVMVEVGQADAEHGSHLIDIVDDHHANRHLAIMTYRERLGHDASRTAEEPSVPRR